VEVLRLFNKSLECGDDNIDPMLRMLSFNSHTRKKISLIATTSEHYL